MVGYYVDKNDLLEVRVQICQFYEIVFEKINKFLESRIFFIYLLFVEILK